MSAFLSDPDVALHHGDAEAVLRELPAESVHMAATSPPFFGLRDYGVAGQIGLEATPEEYVARLVSVFREVRRVLRGDATLWLNLGDTYAGSWGAQSRGNTTGEPMSTLAGTSPLSARQIAAHPQFGSLTGSRGVGNGVKPKDLLGIPWRGAFALQADGWYLRSDIIWAKPNPMPESVTDRPTKAHEYVFLLSKRPRYYFDAEALSEASVRAGETPGGGHKWSAGPLTPGCDVQNLARLGDLPVAATRNTRSVWPIATQPYPEAHFATFPEELVRRMILAGSPEGGTVLDPFVGSGTTCLVARKHGRRSIGIDLSADYLDMAARRLSQLSLLAEAT